MTKTFTRKKQFDVGTIRFSPERLAQLYMQNLKREIGIVSHLVNCPLNEEEANKINEYVMQIRDANKEIEQNQEAAKNVRIQIKKYSRKGHERKRHLRRYLFKSKIYNNNIINERKKVDGLRAQINKIVSIALKRESVLETRKWLARKVANEKAQRKLDRIAARKGK